MEKPLPSVYTLTMDIPVGDGTLRAVRGIDVDPRRGETRCLVDESGSGKSLTLLGLMGLLDKSVLRTADRMAMIFQEPMISLNPACTIADEPDTALDVTIQAQILNLPRDLRCALGLSRPSALPVCHGSVHHDRPARSGHIRGSCRMPPARPAGADVRQKGGLTCR